MKDVFRQTQIFQSSGFQMGMGKPVVLCYLNEYVLNTVLPFGLASHGGASGMQVFQENSCSSKSSAEAKFKRYFKALNRICILHKYESMAVRYHIRNCFLMPCKVGMDLDAAVMLLDPQGGGFGSFFSCFLQLCNWLKCWEVPPNVRWCIRAIEVYSRY